MKLLKHSIKPRVLWLLASLAALLISAPPPWLYGQKSRDEKQSVTRWINQDDDHKRSLEVRGQAEFNDDYTDVVSVTEGGFVIVEEQRGRESQRYEVRRDMGGQLTRVCVYTGDTRLKSAFLKVVESIKSDYERGRVLSALLKNKQIG